jgi:hypothetical protein
MRPFKRIFWLRAMLAVAAVLAFTASARSFAQQATAPAFVIVERLGTTGPESIQEQYGKVSREIVAKFGGPLSRSKPT